MRKVTKTYKIYGLCSEKIKNNYYFCACVLFNLKIFKELNAYTKAHQGKGYANHLCIAPNTGASFAKGGTIFGFQYGKYAGFVPLADGFI